MLRRCVAVAMMCACISVTVGAADARPRQGRRAQPVRFDFAPIPPRRVAERIDFEPRQPGPRTPSGLLDSWSISGGWQAGVGRYAVGPIAQPTFHTERPNWSGDIRTRNSNIAGAGMSLNF